MFAILDKRLRRITEAGGEAVPAGGLIGLEKEALRVAGDGRIAQTPHPAALGAALTHPYITTDYSEALLELITPPFARASETRAFLRDAHILVHQQLQGELLWTASMPCIVDDPGRIPIARYGDSNAGRMKHIYRVGLGHRYGRMMQVIAGVHFNYSLPEAFWPAYQTLERDQGRPRDFIDRNYFALIRNLQRFGWIIPYLFGASPAVCDSFLTNRETHLETLHGGTRFERWATSLRMGDIGYTNRQEACAGMKACYNDLACYVDSLSRAISTPCKFWEKIGVRDGDGGYRQLNANLLQIENEYYSTVRPKQIQRHMEKPVHALRERGVRYVELRSLDIDPFDPLGISLETMRFVEAFMIFCLLADSPLIDQRERRFIDRNLEDTAHNGRACDFQLARHQGPIRLGEWLDEILARMEEICRLLDQHGPESGYLDALRQLRESRRDPDHTPSARIIAELRESGRDFFDYTYHQAQQHRAWFLRQQPGPANQQRLEQEAAASVIAQRAMEQAEQAPFDQFLAAYFRGPSG